MAKYNYRWSAKHQQSKIEKSLLYYVKNIVAKYSPFYRKFFVKNQIDVNKLRNINDISKIPPITKAEHLANPIEFILRPYKPTWWECPYETKALSSWSIFKYWWNSQFKVYYRDIFAKQPVKESERIIAEAIKEWLPVHFHSTESSLSPSLIAYTKRDLTLNIPEIVAQIYSTGFRENWEVLNLMPAAPSVNFFQSVWTPISVGGGTFFSCGEEMTSIDQQIHLINNITFETILSTPSYIEHWLRIALEKLEKKEINPISSVKLCLLAGEPLTNEHKNQIKSLFNQLGSSPSILESYSNNRIKVSFLECSEHAGIHLNPRYFYWEVLDTKTLEPVSENEKGYLCFSHVDWRGTIFLRYNTGDIVQGLEWTSCEKCGLTLPILKGPIVRKETDYIKLNRKEISKLTLENAIQNIPGINSFQIIISKQNVIVFVNARDSLKKEVEKTIQEQIKHMLGISPTITFEDFTSIRNRLFSRGILKAEKIILVK